MATLTIDLNDRADLLRAHDMISTLLGSGDPQTDADDWMTHADPATIAKLFDDRISASSEGARLFLSVIANFESEFTLADVAKEMEIDDVAKVRGRKMLLGRTEKRIARELGLERFDLLRGEWNGVRNTYSIEPDLRDALRPYFPRTTSE